MNTRDLYLPQWDNLLSSERLSVALQIANPLPKAFQFVDVRLYKMGDQQHYVALFKYEDAIFAFVPGATVLLGYDRDQPFHPTAEQFRSWQGTVAEYDLEMSLHEYICYYTTPLRQVSIDPFLLEVTATEVGMEPLDWDDLEFKMKGSHPEIIIKDPDRQAKIILVHFDEGKAWYGDWLTHQQIVDKITKDGFRLPTSDEWEYACAAGSRTLFRWGDYCPANCDPNDEECKDFFQREPNAFGLHIAKNPYHWECVKDSHVMRGGDGGGTICGGAGFFVSWLTLASSFLDQSTAHDTEPIPGAFARRAFPLS